MRRLNSMALLACGLYLTACGDDDEPGTYQDAGAQDTGTIQDLAGGSDSASGDDASTTVRYAQVQPILQSKCAPCHTVGGSGGVNHAQNYEDTQKDSTFCNGKKVFACMLTRVSNGSMPQGKGCTGVPAQDTGNSACLTASELQLLEDWVNGGGLQ